MTIEARHRSSPNAGPRRGVDAPDLVVLHYTQMPSVEAALDRLCDADAAVSAHYLVEPGGVVWRLVDEAERAWHAGVSYWSAASGDLGDGLAKDVNSRSIGVELAHPGHDAAGCCPPFPEAQMRALEALLRGVMARWPVPAANVLAHSDVAPGRKIDPGEKFDWARLARRRMAEPPPPETPPVVEPVSDLAARFVAALRRIGFGDWPNAALQDAFRRRWRPSALDRPLETADLALAEALAARRGPVE